MSEKLRMNAYYYGFDETGVDEVDLILSSVAIAGKAYHNTDQWCEEIDYMDDKRSVAQKIQDTANVSADSIKKLKAEVEKLRAENETLLDCAKGNEQELYFSQERESKLKEQLSELKQANEWKTIDSAPKDGTDLLVFDKFFLVTQASCSELLGWQLHDVDGGVNEKKDHFQLTHWRPLPEAPK